MLSSHTATVIDDVSNLGYTSVIFVDLGVKVDGTCYTMIASSYVTTVAACHMSCL